MCETNFSIAYLAEGMDSTKNLTPLFEVRLELLDPDVVFVPSLNPNSTDTFLSVIENLIKDILLMATLIPRVASG